MQAIFVKRGLYSPLHVQLVPLCLLESQLLKKAKKILIFELHSVPISAEIRRSASTKPSAYRAKWDAARATVL